MNESKFITRRCMPQQQPHGRHVRAICEDPATLRAAIESVKLTRRRVPHAQYLQLVCITGRRTVDAFWCAPIDLDLRSIAHDGNAKQLVLIGVGQWFRPIVTRDVLAGCILPANDIERAPENKPSLLDLRPLNTVADWLHSRATRA